MVAIQFQHAAEAGIGALRLGALAFAGLIADGFQGQVSPGAAEADETVRFAIDGTNYEIDLTTRHATELRAALNVYVGAARKVRAPRGKTE